MVKTNNKNLTEEENQKDVKKFNSDEGLMVSLDSDHTFKMKEENAHIETTTEKLHMINTDTQKQKLTACKELITAVYFDDQKRLLTYNGIDLLRASLELLSFQRRLNKPITMLIFNSLPVLMHSWELEDYQKYIKNEGLK